MNYELIQIKNDIKSFQKLIDLYHNCKQSTHLELSFSSWFAANMSAALGGILDEFEKNGLKCTLDKISTGIEEILSKNGFLSVHFNQNKHNDVYHTTIPYNKLSPTFGNQFTQYISSQLLNRNELPHMSSAVKEKMTELIHELFVNAQTHSGTDFIYTCGQFYPMKKKIEFTIVDTGRGFKYNVNNKFNKNLTAAQAIKWAVQDKNTTKDITGGIGLAMLKEFTELNKGKIQIVSKDGYYLFYNGVESSHLFNGEFPGTIINIQFKTNDNRTYFLKNELNIEDIF